MNDFKNILLIKPSSLGDIVHALPTAAVLRKAFPQALLTWLVKPQWADVLQGNAHVDQVLPLEFSVTAWPAAVRAVREPRFDLVVDLQGLFRSALLGRLSGAPVRIGFANGREGSPWFYNRKVPVRDIRLHAVERYLLIAHALSAVAQKDDSPEFLLPHDADAETRISRLLTSDGTSNTGFVALNPGARWVTKQWPPASFAAVADQLEEKGFRTVIIGANDRAAQEVIHRMRTRPIDLSGQTSIKELIELLRRVRLLITNDSGPMHVAAAIGTPVVALFGPTDARRTGPYGTGHVVLYNDLPCSPCLSRRCRNPNTLECLTTISPAHVVRKALTLLRAASEEKLCPSTKNC
jgi:lipopolysaccharide heptosyltransferase I